MQIRQRVIILLHTSIEHPAVLNTCQYLESEGFEVTYLPVDENGLITPEQVKDAIKPNTILIIHYVC